MRPKNALIFLSFTILLACSNESTPGSGSPSIIESGRYILSLVSPDSSDKCNLATMFPNSRLFGVEVAGDRATFRFTSPSGDPDRDPVLTVAGTTMTGSKTYDSPASGGGTCVETVTIGITGQIVGFNEFEGTLTYQASQATSASGCTASLLQYDELPCSSSMTFHAEK